jgi:hypothetical protein
MESCATTGGGGNPPTRGVGGRQPPRALLMGRKGRCKGPCFKAPAWCGAVLFAFHAPLNGVAPNGAESEKPTIDDFGNRSGLLPPRTHQERWGARFPTFPDGRPGARRPFLHAASTNFGFYLTAPFGAASFCGYPSVEGENRLRLERMFDRVPSHLRLPRSSSGCSVLTRTLAREQHG